MRILLDTHALIWLFHRDPTLSPAAKKVIADGRNQVVVSAVTAWEIAIKRAAGKLRLQVDYHGGLSRYRLTPLSISTEHALAVESLPWHHRDPFDRLLIAQARLEGLVLVTRDRRFAEYGVDHIEA